MHKRLLIWMMISFMIFLSGKAGHPAELSEQDKAQLAEALRLKKSLGPSVWPGFGGADIPLILYDEAQAFLVGHPDPPAPWTVVPGDSYGGQPYYCRDKNGFQAFAFLVGDIWAASLDTLGYMNRSMREQLRENIPPEKLTPAVLKSMEITPAYHTVALLHEAFHAFQATQDRDRFLETQKLYALEKLYPFEDEAFQNAWDKEGNWLASALHARDPAQRLEAVERFLDVRAERRSVASLPVEQVTFEREIEWLEGTAKYVEMQLAVLASAEKENAGSKAYRVVRNRLQADLSYRIKKLGNLEGDLRFYVSGAAQAMILDTVYPDWKKRMTTRKNLGLEDLLKAVLEKNLPDRLSFE